MAFKPGTKVIWTEDQKLFSGLITKEDKDIAWLYGAGFPLYAAFLYPDTAECRQHLLDGIALRQRQQQETDDYMTLTYQLNNKLVQEGLK